MKRLLCWLVPALLLVISCGDDTPQENGCIEGATQACACTDGSTGAQTCNANGTFDACVCGGSNNGDAGMDAANNENRNACGGFEELSIEPGGSCGDCDDGVLICDGLDDVRCVGASERNGCGGCSTLSATPETSCGACKDGLWTCDGTDAVTCEGATPTNVCGGCDAITGDLNMPCEGASGVLGCTSENDLVCINFGENACGGTAPLTGKPATACGECLLGKYACDPADPDVVVCEDDGVQRNACGGCSQLSATPGDSCGSCGGVVVCNGSESVRCDAQLNACGGCGTLANLPGSPCTGGINVCDGTGGVTCSTTANNACGGAAMLDDTPGDPCGDCSDGTVICAALNLVSCVDDTPLNGCGGCTALPRQPGETCGPEELIACDGTDAVQCVSNEDVNECGGTATLPAALGEECSNCGVWACDGADALRCINQDNDDTDIYNCGGCGPQFECGPNETCVGGITGSCMSTAAATWVDIELGTSHGCALDSQGAVHCWGDNSEGQLGIGGINPESRPQPVGGLGVVVDIAVSDDFTCVVETGSVVKCWGSAIPEVFGSTTNGTYSTPHTVTGVTVDIDSIDAGGQTVCAWKTLGEAQCWGDNGYLELGYNATPTEALPGPVVNILTSVTEISVGDQHACAIDNGTAFCWGHNLNGRTGVNVLSGTTEFPTSVNLGTQNFTDISAGENHTCGVSNGEVYCWGSSDSGQVTGSNNWLSPYRITPVGSSDGVHAGSRTSFSLRPGGGYVAWGRGAGGRLGNNSNGTFSPNTNVILGGSNLVDLDSTDAWSCAIDGQNDVYCWGSSPSSSGYPPVLLDGQIIPTAPKYVPQLSPYINGTQVEICYDGVDNDGDQTTDCADPDCYDSEINGTGQYNGANFSTSDGNQMNPSAACVFDIVSDSGIERRFRWTAPSTGDFIISADTTYNSFYVLDGCNAGTRAQLACHSNATLASMMMPEPNRFSAVSGETYIIVVEGAGISSFEPGSTISYIDGYLFNITVAP